jgi:dCTP deaminase
MAVLSDHEIWSLLRSGLLKIDPVPAFDAVSPSAVDLTLDSRFTRLPALPAAVNMSIDTRDSRQVMDALASLGQAEPIAEGRPLLLEAGEFVLAWTAETISLPNFLCARVEGRSTLARLGLSIHQTAPTVHATFTGKLQLELRNGGPYRMELYPGTKVCQLIVEQLSMPAQLSLNSIHQGQP